MLHCARATKLAEIARRLASSRCHASLAFNITALFPYADTAACLPAVLPEAVFENSAFAGHVPYRTVRWASHIVAIL